jgi:hypothetical protein
MKIELDLSEVFCEEGAVNPSIKDGIIETVSENIYEKIERDIQRTVSGILEKEITKKVKETLDAMMPEILNYEFVETSRYGVQEKPITVKNRILKDIAKELTWRDGTFDSDKTVYTKTVKSALELRMKEFKTAWDKEINALFMKEAMLYAKTTLAKKLEIKD